MNTPAMQKPRGMPMPSIMAAKLAMVTSMPKNMEMQSTMRMSPNRGRMVASFLPRMVLVWNCCCPKMVVSQVSVSGCSRKESRLHQLQQKSR